ncbi:hypothetical protein HK097_001238, partial [Rhizophlyctis rosea]
ISEIMIIERGKNVLSCSKDGTAKLWVCGTGDVAATIAPNVGSLLCMALGGGEEGGETKESADSREVGTFGKTVFLGSDSGTVVVYDLFSKSQTLSFTVTPQTPITAIHACTSRGLLVVGTVSIGSKVRNYRCPPSDLITAYAQFKQQSGLVELYDYTNPTTQSTPSHLPLASFRRNDASITWLKILPLSARAGSVGGKEHGGHEGNGVERRDPAIESGLIYLILWRELYLLHGS